jgi:hypothetical protein
MSAMLAQPALLATIAGRPKRSVAASKAASTSSAEATLPA